MEREGVIFLKQHSKQRISIILIKYQGHYEEANNINNSILLYMRKTNFIELYYKKNNVSICKVTIGNSH
jgi:hypothetical protein